MTSPAKRGSTPLDSPKGEKGDINRGKYSRDVSHREAKLPNTVGREFKRAMPS